MGACKVEINGDQYYVQCSQVENINYEGNYLYSSNGSVTLYSAIGSYQGGTVYPQITVPAYSKAYIRYSNTNTQQLAVNSYRIVNTPINYLNQTLFLIPILCVLVLILFKRR